MLGRDTSAGRSAGLCCLEFLAVWNSSADFFYNGAQGGAHGDLHQTGVVNLAAQCEYLGSFGLLSTHGSKPLRTVQDNLRNVCVGLYVI